LLDLSIAATLAAIAELEGIRRISPDAIVLRRLGLGRWTIARPQVHHGFGLVSWCIPIALPIVLPADDADTPLGVRRMLTRFKARNRRARSAMVVVRCVSILLLACLVFGVPAAARADGARGLAWAIAAVLWLCLWQAFVVRSILRTCGMPPRQATVAALGLMNPFSAQRAAEVMQEQVIAGMPRTVAAYALLGEEQLLREMRPEIFDAMNADASQMREILVTLIGVDRLTEALCAPPLDADAGNFCPRCATQFDAAVSECCNCDGIELIPHLTP
jgi:hypothetical protein